MYQKLSKDVIEIVPYLPKTKRSFNSKSPLYKTVNAILYKLRTGVQWVFLPVESLFSNMRFALQNHFRSLLKMEQIGCMEILLGRNLKV